MKTKWILPTLMALALGAAALAVTGCNKAEPQKYLSKLK